MALSSTDGNSKNKLLLTIKDITLIAILSAIIFVQEELLTFIPNIQLTIFLLVLYSKKMGFFRTTIILVIHVLLDNLVMGSFSVVYTPAMFIGWMSIPIFICTICKKTENPLILSIFAGLSGFIYSWCFVVPMYFVYHMDPIAYLTSDIIFELILAGCGFITTLLLYKPCAKVFDHFMWTKTISE